MEKACGFNACNHSGSVDACGLNQLGIGCRGCVVSVGGDAIFAGGCSKWAFATAPRWRSFAGRRLATRSNSVFAAIISPFAMNKHGT